MNGCPLTGPVACESSQYAFVKKMGRGGVLSIFLGSV